MNVLVLVDIEQRHKDILLSSIKDGNFVFSLPNEVSDEEVKKADIIVGAVKLDQIKDSKNLKLLQLEMAGTGAYAKKGNLPKGTILTNASGAYGLAISEHMIGSVFELNKKLNLYRYNQMAHNWKDEGRVTAIQGSTTLVVGLGDIGGEFATVSYTHLFMIFSTEFDVKSNPKDVFTFNRFSFSEIFLPPRPDMYSSKMNFTISQVSSSGMRKRFLESDFILYPKGGYVKI